MDTNFLEQAALRYRQTNASALRWMLARPRHHEALIDTKFDSILLTDRAATDLWRGPQTQYGWIQGRALEALIEHARDFTSTDPDLAQELFTAARELYRTLARLYQRDGHAYFTYDADLRPVYRDADDRAHPQAALPATFTYSDVFVLKGLFAAACEFDEAQSDRYAAALVRVAQAVEEGRFISDERQDLLHARPTPGEYGPRMIMLGAAALLKSRGRIHESAFGGRFITDVMTHHRSTQDLLVDEQVGQVSNLGHAVEFVGFSLEYLGEEAPGPLVHDLQTILLRTVELGLQHDGLALSFNISTGTPVNPLKPWWSLPETIRAAALAYQHLRSEAVLEVWRAADLAFYSAFWRHSPPVAYQMRDDRGPVDVAPATPDLDPGYHTGLSLRAAMHAASGLLSATKRSPCSIPT